ncbi:TIGR03619 family F420-dependent LLM class oxidoreductase [Pseudonocardia endophytica]|uniref:Putative F420-dependent oxidoreductase n=1 Tax=Pseudonocardia endophytica TaxID=401976 RepID=A0A4R1HKU8_PSEEN|nr:TIGR03619 family F420-dependent LLM class oxidoreductase [Pseudonocardia endophytica]TCK21691.1 putative F420-dependent oxidoreductase [Pseudonocardia endophytica]
MRIGFGLPQFGRAAEEVDGTMRFAAAIEERGAASVWAGDRLLAAVDPRVGYAGGPGIPRQMRAAHDPMALITAAAAATSRVHVGTSTLNAPWYPAALLARQATTLDRISGGRLLLGLGTGWSPEEYDAVGVPMGERGDRLDECLDVFATWWHDDPVRHVGKVATIAPSHVQVKPHGVPIYLAGFAERARRRVAERADGFLPVIVPGVGDLAKAVTTPWERVRGMAADAGRDPGALDAILRINVRTGQGVDDVVATLRRVAEETEIGHAFVDLMYVADDAATMLDLATRILDAAG